MDVAWDVRRQVVVEAVELSYRRSTDSGPFECLGCFQPATPVAVHTELTAAHFRAQHLDDCMISGDPALVRRDGVLAPAREQLTDSADYPARMVEPDKREQTDPAAAEPPNRPSTRSPKRAGSTGAGQGRRPSTATTIRPFCRTFVLYPHNRGELSISLPGVEADKYLYAFKRLHKESIIPYPNRRIFYAEVAWSMGPDLTDTAATVYLYAGERDPETPARVTKPYRVVIDWSSWDKRLCASLRREITTAAAMARDHSGSSARSWMFFLADQNPADHTTFHLNHHAYYRFATATITHPERTTPPRPRKTTKPARPRRTKRSPRRR
ncbi:hypothetical protein [Nocardia carnea]|uniref:hypothetical protein n=1 Tax=Nocardia carnea TaxID=37328 RepID=UPI002455F5F3|nr:hypothetical protein [Nocardia carnea]